MYLCGDCSRPFIEPETVSEDMGFNTELGWRPIYESYDVCPYCGSQNFGDYAEDEKEEEEDDD